MSKYQSHIAKIKKNTKKSKHQEYENSSNSKNIDDSQDDDVNDESENEYDEEDQDSQDKYFIADDDEVLNEIEEAKRRQKKEQKKKKKFEKIKSENLKNLKNDNMNDSDLEEEDYLLIQENNQKPKKLKKLNDINDDPSENSIFKFNQNQNRVQKQSIFEDDDDDNQIDSSNKLNRNLKNVKNEVNDARMGLFDQSNNKADDLQRKQQIFKRKREDSTADDEERQTALHQKQLQNLKDKFVVEDIDDLFCTQLDQEILNKDIPERLQLKIQDRFKPTQEELSNEAQWVFDNIIENLPAAKESLQQQRIQSIQQKIQLTLQYFRCDNIDIPQIISSRMKFLNPDLDEESIWQIFNLDIEYGKYEVQKKQIKLFFEQIKKLSNQSDEIQNYINSIYYIRNHRDLRDYQVLIDFYKAYYRQELELIAQNDGKKLPVQKNTFVQNARINKYDEFAKKFLLSPSNFVENIQEDKLIHKPFCPQQKMKDIAKDYILNSNKQPDENQKFDKLYLSFIEEVCKYAAVELQCQPELRKILKKFIKENGTIVTQPTEKGMKELDVLHSSYRVKRINKRIQDIEQPDIFLDIIQNESFGFITYEIQVEKIEDFYNNLFEKYQSSEINSEHERKWQIARNEIKKQFCTDANPMNKNSKTILQTIIDEIKDELKEDSENYILKQCKEKYQNLVQMGYFKIRDDQKVQQKPQNNRQNLNELNLIDDDYIQQRERLTVMGAILHPIDNRNFMTTIAIVDHYGELIAHRDFFNLLPPRVRRIDNNQQEQQRPGEIEEKSNHEKCKRQFQEMLRQHQVDLIVVSADCLEARKLKKCLGEFASFKNYLENDHSQDNPKNEEIQEIENKEAFVIWGRPEIPKLFASSHQSQKLLKNMPFVLKKAICLARFEQDPMNEILNLWSPILTENQSLNINLHPLQKLVTKARLMDCLEEINVNTLNQIGIDINILIDHEHQHNQMQFLSGLGPRKSQKFIQKLKQRGKPLYNRMDIWECKIIEKSCFMSCVNFLKVRIPSEKKTSEPISINILDQTRINPRDYELMQRIATYCIFGNEDFQNIDDLKKIQAINELLRNPDKLKEIQNSDFKDQISDPKVPQSERRQNESRIDQNNHIDKIIKEFMYPFKDPREDKNIVRTFDDQKFPSNELFYCLIDETERTFKKGMIVSANVIKVYQSNGNQPARILCRLENGLDGNIHENDADFFGSVNVGSIVQGRVDQIKYGQSANDENFSVSLKCKQSDLRRHDLYAANLENVPEQDLVNLNFKVQEEQTQLQKKLQIQKRKIQHIRFQNISSTIALQQLKREDNGEFYFRPSSRGVDNLTLTWKFYENNIVHIDIRETEKAIGANIGSKLWINEDSFDNLQEIVERYITQCNRLVREVTQHQKFYKCNNMDELSLVLLKEKSENESSIPYKFTIFDEYPQFVIIAYVPKKDVVREFLKVKPKGYFFHHQYQYPFQNMINWFKKSFKTREYQYYLRKAQSPQRIVQLANQQVPSLSQKLNNESNGMQIDSGKKDNGEKWGQSYEQSNVKREYASKQKISQQRNQRNNEDNNENGWGDQPMNSSPQRDRSFSKQKNAVQGWGDESPSQKNVKDERDKDGGGWGDTQKNNQQSSFQSPQRSERNFRGGGGRGRGGQNDGGGGRACFKCGQEGHMSRECPNQDNNYQNSKQKGMGRGGGGRTNKCFNCDQEGHMSKDCAEPRKERPERSGGNKCFNCQKEGHMSRECPEPKKERGGQKCYNCQQDGHMSRDCPEPKRERGGRNIGDDQPPYKRQRNDDGGSFRRQDNKAGWSNEGESKNDWNKSNLGQSQENGWGNDGGQKEAQGGGWENDGGQKEAQGGGWGDNSQDAFMKSDDKQKKEDAWVDNNNVQSQSNGWN